MVENLPEKNIGLYHVGEFPHYHGSSADGPYDTEPTPDQTSGHVEPTDMPDPSAEQQ